MKLLAKLTINVFSLMIVAYLVPGVIFDTVWATVITAVVFGIINTFLKPILHILFLPITIITFGVAAFVINVCLLWLTSYLVPGFHIENFLTAVIASLVLSIVSMFLNKIIKND